jgi:acyl-CoA synthetase (AMP-forming)/AMP-acid ligase II
LKLALKRRKAIDTLSNLFELIRQASNKYQDKTYLISDSVIPDISFNDLHRFTNNFSQYCHELGIEKGDKIATILPNSSLYVLVLLSVIASGRVLIPINPKAGNNEFEHIFNETKPDLIIHDKHFVEKLSLYNYKEKAICVDASFFNEIISYESEDSIQPSLSNDDIAEIVYTSGSTGSPKGVVITHENLMTNIIGIWDRIQPDTQDNFLTITPLFHNSGQFFSTFVPLMSGSACAVVRPELALVNFWDYIHQLNIHWTLAMPTHINFLLQQRKTLSSNTLKGIIVGGAPLEPATQLNFQARFNSNILKTYGLTETCSFATCDFRDENLRTIGSSGKPLKTNAIEIFVNGKIVNERNIEGEIRIKGKNVVLQYFKNPTETQNKFLDGWLATGDLGYIDDNGNVYIIDRIDNMVLVNGENVYPSEVENLLSLLDGIDIGILSSIPHSIIGNELILIYEGVYASNEKITEWSGILRKYISHYKIPMRYLNVSELGIAKLLKAENGKVLRKKMKNLLAEKYTQQITA